MADLSSEANARLQAAEKALQEKWGRVEGKLIAAFATAQFIEAVACSEHAVEGLMRIIDQLFTTVVPKTHPDSRDEIILDTDEFLVKLFSENFPGRKFTVLRDQDGVMVRDESGDVPPPSHMH